MSTNSETIRTEGRYLNPLTDYGFKKVFGEKDIMIAFLTDLLNPKSPIEDVIFLDKEMTADTEDMRGVIYDLRCTTQDGGEFIVEMQNKGQTHFSNRIVYYLSRAISEQGEKGGLWDFELHPVYGVFFMNFHMKGFKPQAIRTIQLNVTETGEMFSDKIKAFTLELPDYKDKPTDYPKSPIEYWLYNLVNMETMTTALPFQAQQPIFEKMGGISELRHMSPEDRNRYMYSLNKYRTNLSVMKNEREEGREEGLAEGIAKGHKKGLAEGIAKGIAKGRENLENEMVMRMHSKGMNTIEIADMLGLEIGKVEYVISKS